VRIERIELRLLRLPLVRFFETSFGRIHDRSFVLVTVEDNGMTGVGECVADANPFYSAETTRTAWHIIADFIAPAAAITTQYDPGSVRNLMLHDGSWLRLRKVAEDYDPSDRDRAYAYIRDRQKDGEVVTGLLHISADSKDMHAQSDTVADALIDLPFEQLCPGNAELQKMQARFR